MGTLTRVLGSASCPPPQPYHPRLGTHADRRGHQSFSNTYWNRAPPAESNMETSHFFIEIRPGFQFVITDMHNKSACMPGTSINESPVSKYNLGFEGGYPTPPPPSPPP
eukprot:scaffold25070_cov73-Phaeocystis_antarctica.AAC.1